MFRPLRSCTLAAAATLALASFSHHAGAQPNSLPEPRPGMLPFSAAVTNGNITFAWPVMPGRWGLFEQQPALTGEWKPVPAEQYRTNGVIVSIILPLPKQAALYRVKRNLALRPPTLPNLPLVPPPPTNRLPPKLPGRP